MDARRTLIVLGFVIFVALVVIAPASSAVTSLGMLAAIVCWVAGWWLGKREEAERTAPSGHG